MPFNRSLWRRVRHYLRYKPAERKPHQCFNENGAVVPITVSTKLSGVDSISIIAAENPSPLTSSYDLAKNTEGYVSTRIKMGKTSDVIAVVKSGDKLYSTSQQVKVTIGGCGG